MENEEATKPQEPVEETKAVMGAPTKYKPELNEWAFKFCLLGLTDAELARQFEVDETTINEWKKVYPEFSQSIADGKENADAQVVNALRERALGSRWKETAPIKVKKTFWEEGKRKEVEEVQMVDVERAAPPDTNAARFWLMNRQRSKWRDKQEIEHTGTMFVIRRAGDDLSDLSEPSKPYGQDPKTESTPAQTEATSEGAQAEEQPNVGESEPIVENQPEAVS